MFGLMEYDGAERSGIESNGMEWSGTEWNRDFIPLFGYLIKKIE
jgi:hypothetical protein